MDISTLKNRNSEKGFTLVELAVVMIIIGILIGGILKGQELITNSRVTATISQTEALGAAHNGFIDQYNFIAGDMPNGAARLAACVAGAPCATAAAGGGVGDGVINVNVGAAPAGEGTAYFGQLLAADLITGMDGSGAVAFGTTNPTAPIGGGFMVGDARNGVNGFTAAELRPRPHIVLNGVAAVVANNTGILTVSQAATLDRRLDDGVAGTGTVISDTATGACRANIGGVATAYDTGGANAAQTSCAIAYRL